MKGLGGNNGKAAVSTKHLWTPEKLSALATDKLKNLRAQSIKHEAPDLTAMCDAELSQRAEKKPKGKAQVGKLSSGTVVTEFHFVCADNRGVVEEGDGTFRSGSWVVAENVAATSLKYGAMLALHNARSVPSYRQGKIIGYSRVLRNMIEKDNWGLEFHVQPTAEPLTWIGDGAGEKGYKWE